MDRAVVLMQLGGPESLEAVEPFLANLLADPLLITLPWWLRPFRTPLARFIARKRAPKVAPLYQLIGGRSPILGHTEAQARALEEHLAERGEPARVLVSMRASAPFPHDVVHALQAAGTRQVLVFPLEPQFAGVTTHSSRVMFRDAAKALGAGFEILEAPSFPEEPTYVEAVADTVRTALARFDDPSWAHVLFSAHSLPVQMVEAGDPYPRELAATIAAVQGLLGRTERLSLAYQSQVGPVKWLGPSTHEEIDRLAAEGVRDLLMVPLPFVSDHLETLYEMDILYGDQARARGLRFERAAALGTHPAFIRALGEVAIRSFRQAT